MSGHPSRKVLEDFLEGRLSSERLKNVVRHLLSDCHECQRAMAPLTQAMFRRGVSRDAANLPASLEDAYERVVASACDFALVREQALQQERAEVHSKLARLLYSTPRNIGAISDEPGFWTWALCEALLEKSWRLRHEDPKGMMFLVQLATEAAQRLDPAMYGAENLADLQARAWAYLANAFRISDQLPLAQETLKRAFEARRQGTGAPLLRARISELAASLMCDLRHFPTAFRLLDLSFTLYWRNGANHEAGKALVKKGLHTGYTGDPEEGVRLLAQGLRLVHGAREPKLPFQILHNILLFRIELGEFRRARRQLWEMRPLYERYADKLNLLRLRWIEGKIFVGLGKRENAVRALLQAKESFEQKRLAYDAALVSFDLASVWLQEGKRKEVRQLIQEMLETFRARYIAREAIASLLMLRDAADRGSLSLDHLDMVAAFFRNLQEDSKPQDPGELH